MSCAPLSPQLQKDSAISSLIGVHTVGGCVWSHQSCPGSSSSFHVLLAGQETQADEKVLNVAQDRSYLLEGSGNRKLFFYSMV